MRTQRRVAAQFIALSQTVMLSHINASHLQFLMVPTVIPHLLGRKSISLHPVYMDLATRLHTLPKGYIYTSVMGQKEFCNPFSPQKDW